MLRPRRRAEQVTVGIGNQAGKGLGPVADVEAEKGRGSVSTAIVDELEHRANEICSAGECGAEQVTVGIGEQAGIGSRPVAEVEAEKGRESVSAAMVDELEHRAIAICSALRSRAEQVTVGIGNQAGPGNGPVAERVVGV